MGALSRADLWFYLAALTWCGALGAAFTFGLLRGLDISAVASLLVALGTFLLAWYTSRSVRATQDILDNQATNFRKSQTIALINQYFQVPLQLNSDTALTPHQAFEEIVNYSGRLAEARLLKEFYNKGVRDSQADQNRRKEYRALVESIPTIQNFYMHAAQLYAEGVLDNRMFLNRFSQPLVALCKALPILNAVLLVRQPEEFDHLNPLRARCEHWIAQNEIARKSSDSSEDLSFPG